MNNEIEKMARKICPRSYTWDTCEGCLEYHHATRCYYHEYAEAFINEGYRKVDEDSVVLSKEEYEDYKKHVDNCIEEYYRGQHEAEVYYKNIQISRERKETAEKILQPLYNACKEDTYGQVVVDFAILENLAKQFGVEIKEYEK